MLQFIMSAEFHGGQPCFRTMVFLSSDVSIVILVILFEQVSDSLFVASIRHFLDFMLIFLLSEEGWHLKEPGRRCQGGLPAIWVAIFIGYDWGKVCQFLCLEDNHGRTLWAIIHAVGGSICCFIGYWMQFMISFFKSWMSHARIRTQCLRVINVLRIQN